MSTTVDSRVVEMQFNNSQFESNVKTSMSTIEKLKDSLNFSGVASSFDSITSSAEKVDMSSLSSAVENVHQKFSALEIVAITALVNITNQAISAGTQLVESLSVDQISAGWEKFAENTKNIGTLVSQGFDLDEVEEQMARLLWYTDETSYNYTDMVSNIAKFTASGQTLTDSVTAMEGIANMAALSGQNASTASAAMYQLSQAMSYGYMKLADWQQAISNKNMDTTEFRQKCLDAAVALGTLNDNLDGTYTTISTGATFTLSSITSELTEGAWLTSEVMMSVFQDYAGAVDDIYEYAEEKGITASEAIAELGDSLDEFGLKAFKAAQEARSWEDVVDSVKDAVSTGWMNTFTYIFGNYEEATELWTDLANAMYDVFMTGINDRNDVLEAWSELGGRTELIEAFWNAWENIGEILGTVKEAFAEVFPSKTADQLYAMTVGLKELTEKFKMSEENLANLKSTFKGLFSILDIGVQAIKAIAGGFKDLVSYLFPAGEGLLSFTGGVGEYITSLDEAIKESEIFEKIVGKIVDALKVFIDFFYDLADNAFVSFYEGGCGVAGVLEVIFDTMANLVRVIHDVIYALTGIDISGFTDRVVQVIQGVRNIIVDFVSDIQNGIDFSGIKDNFTNLISTIKEKFAMPGFEALKEIFKAIGEKIGETIDAIFDFKTSTSTTFDELGDKVSNCTFVKVLGAIWVAIVKVANTIKDVLSKAIGNFITALGNADMGSFFDILNELVTGGILVGIVRLINNFASGLGDIADFLKDFKKGAIDVLDNFGSVLESWSLSIKADALLKIAAAVGILAIALIALTGLDAEQMGTAVAAITALFADLVAAMAVFQKLCGTSSNSITEAVTGFIDSFSNAKQYSNMIKMAAAIAILAAALAIVASIDENKLTSSLGAITGLFADLVVAMIAMNKLGGKVSGLTTMIGMAASIYILSGALKSLAELDWDELARGVAGVTALCADLVVAMIALNKFGGSTKGIVGMIALAAAVKILASACKTFADMDWEEIAKGLVGVGVLLVELGVFTKLVNNSSGLVSAGVAMIAVAAAMKIFASAVGDFGQLSLTEIAKGLISIGVALAEVTVAMNTLPKDTLSKAVGLVVVGAALEIIANVMSKIGNMSVEQIAKGLVAIGVALAEFTVALNLMKGTLSGSAALLVAATAIGLLTPALLILGNMSVAQIAKSLITLAGAFTIIGVAAAVLSPLTTTILALAAAFALIGVGVAAVGVGLVAAGAGISAIAVGITTLAAALAVGLTAIVTGIKTIILAIVELIPDILIAIGEGIIGICEVIANGAPTIGEAIKAIILTLVDVLVECVPELAKGALQMLLGICEALIEYAPQVVAALVQLLVGIIKALTANIPDLLIAVMEFFGTLFGAIVDAINGMDTAALLQGIVCIGLLSALVVALSAISALVPLAMVALAELGVLIAEMALIFAAVGALAQIPGLTWLIDEGAVLLESIGNAIGSFIGGIVGGFAEGVSSSFPQIGADLSAFMENAEPFIEGAKNIDSGVMSGVLSLAEVILVLTAANILEGLTSWFTGGTSIVDFGKELAEFGPYFAEYYESVQGINADVVEASANAALALAEMANNLPNSGGVVSWFTGDNTLSVFGKELAEFGPYLAEYAKSVDGLDGEVVMNSANAAKALAELADNLPNSGGLLSFFTGDNDMESFGKQLAKFGASFSEYYDSISNVNTTKLTAVTEEFGKLVELSKGLASIDTSGLSTFGKNLKELGNNGIDEFISAFENSNSKVTSAAATMLAYFVDGVNSNQSKVTTSFTTLVTVILTVFDLKYASFKTAGETFVTNMINGINAKSSTAQTAMTTVISSCLTQVRTKYSSFKTAGENLVNYITNGVNARKSSLVSAFDTATSTSENTVRGYYSNFYSAGVYLVNGFVQGISDNITAAANAAAKMAKAASDAAKSELDINSPSKVGYSIGDFFGLGFTNAIDDSADSAFDSASDMANAAKTGLSNAISKISDLINGELDTEPTISPVLDLSNVEEGVGTLSTLFSRTQAMSISAGMSGANDAEIQNGTTNATNGNVYQFTQNNYSPKSLSRVDIYRQTKNQFSALERMVEA